MLAAFRQLNVPVNAAAAVAGSFSASVIVSATRAPAAPNPMPSAGAS